MSPLVLFSLVCISLIAKCQDFKAEQLATTSTIILKGKIDKVFPLFGAFDEKKWTEGWNPTPIFPAAEKMEQGLIFKTPGHVHGEADLIWVVLKFDTIHSEVNYLVICPNRIIRITVQCSILGENATRASVTYQITGLNSDGNKIALHMVGKLSDSGLKDWQLAINEYLAKTNN